MGFWFFKDQNVQAKSDGTFVNADTGDPAMRQPR